MRKWLKRKAINFIARELLKGVTAEDILQITKTNGIIYKGQQLDKESRDLIKVQAAEIDELFLWKILNEEMQYLAQERMFSKSESFEAMLFGKVMLYLIEEQRKRIKFLKNLK